jgi:hypothetical protein
VRLLLIRSFLAVFCALLVWLTVGPQMSSLIDRFFTVPYAVLPLGRFELDASQFIIGSRRWIMAKDLRIVPDSHNRITLSTAGRTFTFGPITNCSSGSAGACFEFTPDRDDQISFLKSRSWLSWPTPFQFSIMGGPRTSWRRHSYNRLLWKKSSGATIEFVWRDEQGFYVGHGWADGNLEIAPLIKLKPSPFEETVVRYLSSKKGWKRDEYRLESRGTSVDSQSDVTAVIFLKDESATHPGAGQSVDVFVDRTSGQVIKEVGRQ